MFDFFRKNKSPTDVVEKKSHHLDGAAPGTSISYHHELIPQLRSEHKTLLTIYAAAGQAVRQNDFAVALSSLLDFKKRLQSHLLAEDVSLYIYLEHCFVNDRINARLVHNFRKEMNAIGVATMQFLKKYQTNNINSDNAEEFLYEYEKIGYVFRERIHKEEDSLYPLYLPAIKY